jgi:hypothetical protein
MKVVNNPRKDDVQTNGEQIWDLSYSSMVIGSGGLLDEKGLVICRSRLGMGWYHWFGFWSRRNMAH